MEGYRVLLVDDEAHIRQGISQKMDWTSLGFSLIGEAENGQEALELAEQLRPDVILTDIQMPFMDGLELCQRLAPRLPASKFVVFSGFDDFEYAKQAIRMNVSEYILKPINALELMTVLQNLKEQLDTERAERKNLENIRHLYEESLPVLRELFFTRLLDGRTCADRIHEEASRYQIDVSPQFWQVALIRLEHVHQQRELITLSVQQLMEEHLQVTNCQVRTFLYGEGVACLAGFQGIPQPYALIDAINRVCKLSKSYLSVELTVGVGAPCNALSELVQSTAGAHSALEYRVLLGTGRAIYIGDLEPKIHTHLSFEEQDERALTNAVKLGSEEEIREVVAQLVTKVQQAGSALSQSHLFFLELVNCLLKLVRSAELELEEVFGVEFTGAMQITDFPSPQALGDWCLQCCLQMRELIGRQRTDSAGRTIGKAKDFIGQHFSESDLSVEMLCDYLHLSPAYFSTLFKRETGMSFTAYVTVIRMEEAARLLRTTEDKTYLIAEQTGYVDPNYFSYVFKRHFGLSPTKYRSGGG